MDWNTKAYCFLYALGFCLGYVTRWVFHPERR